MLKNIKKHLWYYVAFLSMQLVGLVLVLSTAYNRQLQLTLIIITTFCYIGWALLHQYSHHKLTAKIFTEYVLIGALGMTLSLFLFGV